MGLAPGNVFLVGLLKLISKGAEMLTGNQDEVIGKLIELLRAKGGLK